MKHILLTFLLSFISISALWGQNPADSAALSDRRNWLTVKQSDGLLCRVFDSRRCERTTYLFDTVQIIWITELDPSRYGLRIVQPQVRTRVSKMARQSDNAAAAINGGFFVTGTDRAIPNDFLKIDGQVVSPEASNGWGNAAVAFNGEKDPTRLVFFQGTASASDLSLENIMTAGPLLVADNKIQVGWENPDKRSLTPEQEHAMFAPRTAIGTKPDGTIVLLVVDGRRKDSFGMSFPELAQMARWLGVTDLLNLDGGGSSAMWVKGRGVVNSPSDGIGIFHLERKVANSIQALPRRK